MRAALPFNYNFEVQLLNFYVHTDCPIKKYCSLRKQLKSRMNERISKQKNMKFHKKWEHKLQSSDSYTFTLKQQTTETKQNEKTNATNHLIQVGTGINLH